MPAMPRVLTIRAVGQNQIVPGSSQQPGGGLLNLLDQQRRLVRTIIEIRHLTLRSQRPQNLAKPRRAIRICRSAQGYDPPKELRMGQYIAAAPERLVIRVGDDNSSPGPMV
jgi:hypothetical protein